jgi:hypothetical protein
MNRLPRVTPDGIFWLWYAVLVVVVIWRVVEVLS